MVKINAMVSEDTRKALRLMAADKNATAQAMTAAAITVGLKVIQTLSPAKLQKILQPDGRRRSA